MKLEKTILLAFGALGLPLAATPIGSDDFTYADGIIQGNNGGVGWAYNRATDDQTNVGGVSLWANSFGDAFGQNIVSNALVTGQLGDGGSLRFFGGNDFDAFFQASGIIFYKVELTRSASATYSHLSHMDGGTPRVEFGVPFEGSATDTIGIKAVTGDASDGLTLGSIDLTDDTTYTLVCVLDFDNDKVAMYVDPDASNFWLSDGTNNADVERTFTNGNWANGVRLASNGDATWDNLELVTTPAEVGLATFVDADGDGLPLGYELANGLDDNDDGTVGETSPGAMDGPNGAAGDPDSDLLTNLQEYQGADGTPDTGDETDPQDADTDDDNLTDNDEVNITSTDPLDADSDNDEILDGEEVIAGTDTYITDPNLADTDGGGVNDGSEVTAGTDPTTGNGGDDPASFGDLNLIGIEKFDYPDGSIDSLSGGDGFDYDNLNTPETFVGHTGSQSDWNDLFGDPQIFCQRLRTQENGALREFNGLSEGNAADSSELSGAILAAPGGTNQIDSVLWVKVDMTRSSGAVWSGISLYSYGNEEAFIGTPGFLTGTDGFGYEETGAANEVDSGLVLPDGSTNTIVLRLDQAAGFLDAYLNPNLAGPDPFGSVTADIEAFFTATDITAIRLASGGSGPTDWDNLCISATWAGLSTAPANTGGLRDSFVEGFGLVGGAAGNDDSDTLTNLQEQDNGTNPLLADTDSDNANDDVEVSGSANSFPNPTTDPCNPDSDGDGALDGDEISGVLNVSFSNEATDPNDPDTDGDTYTDLVEINNSYDPNDAGSNPAVDGLIIVDGIVDSLVYGPAAEVQTINSAFGSNELDAAYANVSDGKLYLMITGNLQDNFNKLEIFLDTGSQITTNVFTAAGNDASNNMDGMTFDVGFSPEYHLIARRGFADGAEKFDLDISNLSTSAFDQYASVFGAANTGSGTTATGTVNSSPIEVGYDDSNTAGINDGDNSGSAADQVAAAAVTTGLEICIDLGDIGSPSGSMNVMILLNNDGHNFASNQTLAGLPVGTDNLGDPTVIDFGTFTGDQFFTIAVPVAPGDLALEVDSFDTSTNMIMFNLTGMENGETYSIFQGSDLSTPLSTDTGVNVTDATPQPFAVPADELVSPMFFQAVQD